jgi:hypothetical protein
MTVTVDAYALKNAADAELDRTGPVPGSVARRIACDASVMRVVLSGHSEPLDVGRRTQVIAVYAPRGDRPRPALPLSRV